MINYSDYKADDFLSDENFRQWVLEGGFRNTEASLSKWLNKHPDQKKEAMIAREFILAIHVKDEPFADDYFETISRESLGAVMKKRNRFSPAWVWRAAAAVVLISGLLGWYNWKNQNVEDSVAAKIITIPAVKIEFAHANTTQSVMPVALPDGSSVLLHPQSNLKYKKMPNGNREVLLTGKAFFEVTKDPGAPFIVYSGEMVTKVLGTSFTITAYAGDADFSVVVKTGKVAVTTLPDKNKDSRKEEAGTTINLIPNEQLVFNREKLHFDRKDLPSKEMLRYVPATRNAYSFEDAPVASVFKEIGAAYGLKIDMDAAIFVGCELTTNLTDEPLFEKLNIVCNAVGPGTTYVVEDGHIRVVSQGCNQ